MTSWETKPKAKSPSRNTMLNGAAVKRSVTDSCDSEMHWAKSTAAGVSGAPRKFAGDEGRAYLRTFWQRGTGTENYGRPSPHNMTQGSLKGQDV